MPPLQAPLALHGLWCLVLLPLVVGAIRWWPARRLWLGARLGTAVAVAGLAVLIGVQTIAWLPTTRGEHRRYLPQRIVYAVATLPEVPLVQSLLACTACWIAARQRRSLHEPAPEIVPSFSSIGCKEPIANSTNQWRNRGGLSFSPQGDAV
jgi:hypothetical protein